MRQLAEAPNHPALTPQAQERRRATRRAQRAAELAWERQHPDPADVTYFKREVAPGLQAVPTRAMARATGLSVSYCAEIKRGERVSHPRWWPILTSLIQQPGT